MIAHGQQKHAQLLHVPRTHAHTDVTDVDIEPGGNTLRLGIRTQTVLSLGHAHREGGVTLGSVQPHALLRLGRVGDGVGAVDLLGDG